MANKFKRYFIWCQPYWDNERIHCLELDNGKELWVVDSEEDNYSYQWSASCSKSIKTLRAFRRYLKKHPELKGHKIMLNNKFYNPKLKNKSCYDIIVKVK